ncbi:DUF6531 domain-containing protein, partial [Frankia sp. Cj3]|uniref:DUF6531 domain-containing protein n=1 Tax=Frankia sp. Cj3 TaxID=2880976 RepID=UPI001EF5814F
MSLDLPDWVIDAFGLLGLPWPAIEEDELRAWAADLRQFADDLTTVHGQSHQSIANLVASSSFAFTRDLAQTWQHHHDAMVAMQGPAHVFAAALDVAADIVLAQKEVVIGAAITLAAAIIATQGEAIFTFGIAEAEVPVEVAIGRTAVRTALQELEQGILGVLIPQASQEIAKHLDGTIDKLLMGSVQVGLEAQTLKASTDTIRMLSATLRGHTAWADTASSHAHSRASSRRIEGKSAGGRWHVVAQLEAALRQIAEKVFSHVPATLRDVYQRTIRLLDHGANEIERVDTGLAGGVPHPSTRPGARGPHEPAPATRTPDSIAHAGSPDPRVNAIPENARTLCRDPIDVATGEVLLTETDVQLPGLLPLVLSRTHVSSYRSGHWFGRSWASTLDQRLEVDDTGVHLATADGMILVYPLPSGGADALPVEGPRWPLRRAADGGYTVTDPQGGWTWHFTRPLSGAATRWPLTAVTDRLGHRIDLVREPDGTPVEVVHSGGYRVRVDTEDQRVVALTLVGADAGGDTALLRFRYSDAGDLAEVVNSSGLPARYGYDGHGRMTEWVDRNDAFYRYTYNDDGRCVSGTGSGGCLSTQVHYDLEQCTTTVVDSFGHATVYRINAHLQVESITDPLGNSTSYTWDRYDRKLSENDPLGRITRYRYDRWGNLTAVIRPDGAGATAEYNDLCLPTRVTAFDGAVWQREYDDVGNLTALTDPAGAATRFAYDSAVHLSAFADPLGNTTHVTSDAAGLTTRITDAIGATTTYERDAAGRVVQITDPVGGVTRLDYTPEGKLAHRTGPDGASEEWAYDPEGNLLTHINPIGATTAFEIGHFDLPAVRVDPDGSRLEFGYDTELRLATVTNPQGLVWHYDYDPAGNLVQETDFNGRVQAYTYDSAAQLTARTNGLDQTVEFTCDALGNVVGKHTPEGITTFSYDPAGRLIRAVSPDADLFLQRDALGRITAEQCNGRTLASRYDAAGRRVERLTPSGHLSTWEYDARHQPSALHTGGQTLRFAYDAAGREISRHIGADLRLTQAWDANHRLLDQFLITGGLAGTGEPSGRTAAGNARLIARRSYRYRTDGYVTGIEDIEFGQRTLALDPVGRVTAVQAAGWTEHYAYDSAGNITQATWPGTATSEAQGEREYTGTLIRRAGKVRYEHDRAGRVTLRQRKQRSTKPLTWRYTWDSEDQLVEVTTPDGIRWRYQYDPLGRRIAKHRLGTDDVVAEQVMFAWDGVRLAEQAAGDGRTTTWDYGVGTFAPASQTERCAEHDQDEIDRRFYAIVTDLTGTPAELVTPDGEVAWRTRTTLWGTTTYASADGVDCPLRFPGQYHDPETGAYYNLFRYYDPETGRYDTTDPLGLAPGPNPHAYVPNPTA